VEEVEEEEEVFEVGEVGDVVTEYAHLTHNILGVLPILFNYIITIMVFNWITICPAFPGSRNSLIYAFISLNSMKYYDALLKLNSDKILIAPTNGQLIY
jgi:hypothetical protein